MAATGYQVIHCSFPSGAVSPMLSAEELGRYLSPPAVAGEFAPNLWPEDPGLWPTPQWNTGTWEDFRREFERAVISQCPRGKPVAVAWSGGIDSTAVLTTLVSHNVNTIALTWATSAELAERRCRIGKRHLPQVEFVPVTSTYNTSRSYHATGPDLSALPAARNALSLSAKEQGAAVLFTGSGADELALMVDESFLSVTWHHVKSRHVWRDLVVSGPRWVFRHLPGALGFLPLRCLLEGWDADPIFSLIHPSVRSSVRDWTDEFIGKIVTFLSEQTWSHAERAAWLQKYPCTPLPDYQGIAEAHPFEEPSVVDVGLRQPLSSRYDTLPHSSSYHRTKAMVVKLIPPSYRGLLGASKDDYGAEILRQTVPRHLDAYKFVLDYRVVDATTLNRWLKGDSVLDLWLVESALTVVASINEWLAQSAN